MTDAANAPQERFTGEASPPAPKQKALWRQVAVPTEHGGWSLTAEPVVLGLIVAWSWPGLAIGVAAVVAFLARTPLRVVLVDRWRDRWLPRTQLAAKIVAGELILIGLLAALATAGADDARFWVPFAFAAPLVGIELWYDMRSQSRRLLPELAGTIGIGSTVAAIVLAGNGSASLAVGLWVVVSARAVAAIPYARTQVLRAHGRPVTRWHSDLAQACAVAAAGAAWLFDAIPLAPVLALAVIAVFNVVAIRGPVLRAVVVGIQQTVFGIALLAITAIAVLA